MTIPDPTGPLAGEAALAVEAAEEAGRLLRRHFHADVDEESKSDGEPVSVADREADDLLRERLSAALPGDAVLTEEAPDDGRRFEVPRVWIVDPLDGTRDFLNGTPEFAVHVGLAEGGAPILGVVHQPALPRTYLGIPGGGAWARTGADGPWQPISTRAAHDPVQVVVSRSHLGRSQRIYLRYLPEHELVRCGSSGLKAALVAEGRCDLYVAATGKMKEWDTCAPHALVEAAGGQCLDLHAEPLRYNKRDLHVRTGFLAAGPGVAAALAAHLEKAAAEVDWL